MKKGYIAFSSLLVISAVVLAVTISVSILSISESQMGYAVKKGEEALFFVEGCLEEALLRFSSNPLYNGGLLNFPEGQCTIVVQENSEDWTVVASGLKDGHARKVEAKIRRVCNQTELISWLEIE
ncbi:hypothetical protein ISS85_01460 [Candidatus Microgenomates bacterium]|nr:hypothetical protein [Candidatus Microgenomates bacterium]